MLSTAVTLLLAAASFVSGQNSSSPYPPFSGDAFKKYNLEAKGIKASFIPYGARLTNLYVKDRHGKWQDVAVGYDNGEQYLTDSETNHTYFGAVVGRYANR
jgi:aldose 1-epimerase